MNDVLPLIANKVSIHAPWEGCDDSYVDNGELQGVSIHAPWEGCDKDRLLFVFGQRVSIHAPWEGCDFSSSSGTLSPSSFNSRTLGRVRLLVRVFSVPASVVSIHAPWEGCDINWSVLSVPSKRFNSRTLGRVRHGTLVLVVAPHPLFQFTHPGKGATSGGINTLKEELVSIHAPWEGCDQGARGVHQGYDCFNSRTLGRVRPRTSSTSSSCARSFNSRTLGRVRPLFVVLPILVFSFNSRTLGRVRLVLIVMET